MFNLDFLKATKKLLPPDKRQVIRTGLYYALLFPLTKMWADLSTYYSQWIAILNYDSRTDILQSYLRVNYPTVGGFNVYVKTNYDNKANKYIQNIGEKHLDEAFIYNLSETLPPAVIGYNNYEFEYFIAEKMIALTYTIFVPVAYTTSLSAIQQIVNTYRPAGSNYNVIFQNLV